AANNSGGSSGGGGGGGSSTGWRWPCASRNITSYFGWRYHPIYHEQRLHEGIDIGASYGAPVWATRGGTIAYAGRYGGYGNYVLINHGGGMYSGYGHMSAIYRWSGWVNAGQSIGAIGSTGSST